MNNKQIKDLGCIIDNCIKGGFSSCEISKYLYEKGYRKQSETVKEFAEKIVKKFGKSCSEYYPEFIEMTSMELYYLAEQYGKEE